MAASMPSNKYIALGETLIVTSGWRIAEELQAAYERGLRDGGKPKPGTIREEKSAGGRRVWVVS